MKTVMKALMLIAAALMISTPVFAAPISKDTEIIKLPRIEVIGKHHDAINKASIMGSSDAPLPQNATIIKLPRIEVIGKRHDAINKAASKLAACDIPLALNTEIVKLPRIEVVGKRHHVIQKVATELVLSDTALAKNAVIIKLPRIEVIAKRAQSPVLPSMIMAAEQGDGVFFNTAMPSMALAKRINIFMPYGV
jgi:hypothetical protein